MGDGLCADAVSPGICIYECRSGAPAAIMFLTINRGGAPLLHVLSRWLNEALVATVAAKLVQTGLLILKI